jgi:mRNA interferase MazF
MKPGDVVLIRLPDATGGPPKLRPALVLAMLPGPYQSLLICGISTQLREVQPNWDERLDPNDADFSGSGLHRLSAIRLSYFHAAESREISGCIGRIAGERLDRLRQRLIGVLAVRHTAE